MKIASRSKKNPLDRSDHRGLFGDNPTDVHVGRTPKRAAEQTQSARAIISHDMPLNDHADYEALNAQKEQKVPMWPVSAHEKSLTRSSQAITHYALLEAVLTQRGLELKAIWTLRDTAY